MFVGCDEGKVVALDVAEGGRTLGTARTGGGVDGIAYDPNHAHLYVPGARAATLTVIEVGPLGALEVLGAVPTSPGAHCAAADHRGHVYICDPRGGRLLVIADPYPASR